MAVRGTVFNASARRFACSRPISVNSIPGSCPGSRCSIFHVVCPCRIRKSQCFILICYSSTLLYIHEEYPFAKPCYNFLEGSRFYLLHPKQSGDSYEFYTCCGR